LRIEAASAFQKIPHGGLEIGAILLGEHEEDRVRIREWRPIECSHFRGPSFILSDSDQERLGGRLAAITDDPELKGLAPVGWFQSRTRSGLSLTPEAIEIRDRFFRGPFQVALLLRPEPGGGARARLFLIDGSSEEVEVKPDPLALLQRSRAPASSPEETPPGAAPSEAMALPVASEPPRGKGRGRFLAVAGLLAGALLAGLFLLQAWSRETAALSLRVESVQGGAVLIRWNGQADCIRDASTGTIEIVDESVTHVLQLEPAELRSGAFTYVRAGRDLRVKLTVSDVYEYAHLLGGPVASQ
jgi:hypothetical protein